MKGSVTIKSRRRSSTVMIVFGLIFAIIGIWLSLKQSTFVNTVLSTVKNSGDFNHLWFEDVYKRCGIDFMHISGQGETPYIPEIMAGGVGLLDYDNDGYLDVYFVQSGYIVSSGPDHESWPSNKLYRNLGNGSFENVTKEAGVGDTGYGMGCTCGDYNNDGLTDIYVTNVGSNVLYQNNGDGTFTDVTEHAGTGDPSFSASAAFFDYDRDGDLDLFVVNYIVWSADTELVCRGSDGQIDYCGPTNYDAPAPDTLYRNNGDGTFTDVSESTGISSMFGNGLGIVSADFNGNSLIDMCIANDGMANQLWINQGDGTFRDEALPRGIAYSGNGFVEAGMGIDAQDVDGDNDYDVFMSHFANETNTLYINELDFMEDRTIQFGLVASTPFTGFGTAMVDLNNDSILDIYVGNGRVIVSQNSDQEYGLYSEPNLLFEGLPDYTFREVMPRGGTSRILVHTSRGVAFGDYDNDGLIDIFVVNRDAAPYVLHNRTNHENHWIIFDVTNKYGSPAIGARVEIEANGRSRIRDVRAAYSYCSSNDPRVHFGLGKISRIEDVKVKWPDGTVESFGSFSADRIIELKPKGN